MTKTLSRAVLGGVAAGVLALSPVAMARSANQNHHCQMKDGTSPDITKAECKKQGGRWEKDKGASAGGGGAAGAPTGGGMGAGDTTKGGKTKTGGTGTGTGATGGTGGGMGAGGGATGGTTKPGGGGM